MSRIYTKSRGRDNLFALWFIKSARLGLELHMLRTITFFVISLAVSINISGQDDEARRATGLPMKIGEGTTGNRMNVSGKITLESSARLTKRPVIKVIVLFAGVPADEAISNDSGYYLVRNVPRDNVSLVVEVDGNEVVRQPITGSAMGNPRYDFTLRWPLPSSVKPSVVSAKQLFSRTPKNQLLFEQALAAAKAHDSVKAVGFFNQVLESEPRDFVAWTELGTLYFKDNSLDNAEACYFKAIELRKDYFVALLNLGKLYVNRTQFGDAILVLSNAVASDSDSAEAHHFLGEAYLQTKKGSLAVTQLNEAIRLAPDEMADLHLRLATLYDTAGMKSKAAAEYKTFLEKRPDHPDRAKLEAYIKANPPK